jgi:hypothetical protein
MKIYPVGAKLLHADGETWRSQWSLFTILRKRLKMKNILIFISSLLMLFCSWFTFTCLGFFSLHKQCDGGAAAPPFQLLEQGLFFLIFG